MEPEIRKLSKTRLVGMKTSMSLSDNKTAMLWRSFMPNRHRVKNAVGSDLYSVEVYDSPESLRDFSPATKYQKWAAVPVEGDSPLAEGMDSLEIPASLYAVFNYKGKPSEASGFYQYIYREWLPKSSYSLDGRPHFAVMGDKYLGEHPDSEEELWIPVTE